MVSPSGVGQFGPVAFVGRPLAREGLRRPSGPSVARLSAEALRPVVTICRPKARIPKAALAVEDRVGRPAPSVAAELAVSTPADEGGRRLVVGLFDPTKGVLLTYLSVSPLIQLVSLVGLALETHRP